MDIVQILINVVSGALGGNAAGSLLKEKNLGFLANTITGILGGAGGTYLLQALDILSQSGALDAMGASGFDIGAFAANVASSGIGGAILTAVISYIKGAVRK